jgi:hypothetical protein
MSALADRSCRFAEINENFHKTVADEIPAIEAPSNFGSGNFNAADTRSNFK